MHDLIVFYTFVALIIFFVTVEIYRARHYIKGSVVEIYQSPLGGENMISTRMKVQLRDGKIVDADAFRCTMCLGNFNIGDEVYLSRAKDKYQVNLPFRFKNTANTICTLNVNSHPPIEHG